ncbi:MAG TPA: hypothetical protein VJI33_00550 [Candidatus Paceibacterota bacterium]
MPRKTLTIFGILLILAQISGLPSSWKAFFAIIVGIYVVFVAMRGGAKEIKNFETENQINRNPTNDGAKDTEIGN